MKALLFSIWLTLMLLAGESLAQAAEAAPFSPDGLKALLPFLLVAALGGAVNFFQKVKAGESRPFNFPELIGELVIAAFAGMLTYWLCQYAGLNQWLMAALVGMAGHGGSRALFVLEKMAEDKLESIGLKADSEK